MQVLAILILDGGRSLYRANDKVKYKEYTLSQLKKRVNLVKTANTQADDTENETDTATTETENPV